MNCKDVSRIKYPDGYEWIAPDLSADYDRLRFDGAPLGAKWVPVPMHIVRYINDGETTRRPSDFPCCSDGDMLILNDRAVKTIGGALSHFGELLPLECSQGSYWAFNVLRTVDALDMEKSTVLRASDNNAVLRIRKHVFNKDRLDIDVFKLSIMPRGLIYMSSRIVDKIRSSGLVGMHFERL